MSLYCDRCVQHIGGVLLHRNSEESSRIKIHVEEKGAQLHLDGREKHSIDVGVQ